MKRRTRPRKTSNRPRTWAQQKQRDRLRKRATDPFNWQARQNMAGDRSTHPFPPDAYHILERQLPTRDPLQPQNPNAPEAAMAPETQDEELAQTAPDAAQTETSDDDTQKDED